MVEVGTKRIIKGSRYVAENGIRVPMDCDLYEKYNCLYDIESLCKTKRNCNIECTNVVWKLDELEPQEPATDDEDIEYAYECMDRTNHVRFKKKEEIDEYNYFLLVGGRKVNIEKMAVAECG